MVKGVRQLAYGIAVVALLIGWACKYVLSDMSSGAIPRPTKRTLAAIRKLAQNRTFPSRTAIAPPQEVTPQVCQQENSRQTTAIKLSPNAGQLSLAMPPASVGVNQVDKQMVPVDFNSSFRV